MSRGHIPPERVAAMVEHFKRLEWIKMRLKELKPAVLESMALESEASSRRASMLECVKLADMATYGSGWQEELLRFIRLIIEGVAAPERDPSMLTPQELTLAKNVPAPLLVFRGRVDLGRKD